MLRALRLRVLASEERELREITEQAEHAVEQTDIDQTTAAGDAALVERAENADRSEDAADQIAHRQTELGRHRARFAVDAHRAGQRLHEIGRAHVRTPVTNAHLVCRLLLEKKNTKHQ